MLRRGFTIVIFKAQKNFIRLFTTVIFKFSIAIPVSCNTTQFSNYYYFRILNAIVQNRSLYPSAMLFVVAVRKTGTEIIVDTSEKASKFYILGSW